MPYRDKAKDREYKKIWNRAYYLKNKDKERERIRKRKQEIKEWLSEYKVNLKCIYCNEREMVCLDFHHLDQTQKDKSLGWARNQGWGKERIRKEIEKCIVLCSNCHRKLHAGVIKL